MSHATANHTDRELPASGCADVPDFTRLRYFHGRSLGALDLRREQEYHVDKARVRNRLLHGWGIVCGLEVHAVRRESCATDDETPDKAVVVVSPGAALDCQGSEIVVRNPRELVLDDLLGEKERAAIGADARVTIYLTLCYHEELIDPSRPLLAAACEPVPACEYGRIRETYRICASTTKPDAGPECEPCCGCCGDACLELAAIDYTPGRQLSDEDLHFSGRRPLAKHDLTEITGINWAHGATYTREAATLLLTQGIEVRFSRAVRVDSLRNGVVDITVIEGGGGRSGGIYALTGAYIKLPDPVPHADGEPDSRTVEGFTYHSTSDETLQFGDRVVITIHGDFVIDECCRAIDANHTGGGVPRIVRDDGTPSPTRLPSAPPCLPRPSGNGNEGGDFISWIFVQRRKGS